MFHFESIPYFILATLLRMATSYYKLKIWVKDERMGNSKIVELKIKIDRRYMKRADDTSLVMMTFHILNLLLLFY